MDQLIKADLYRVIPQEYNFINLMKGFRCQGFRYLFFLRMAAKSKKHSFQWFFFRTVMRHYAYKFGYQIAYNTSIGEGFFIGHFGTVIIHQDAVIGKNCNIGPGVTIGQANRGYLKGVPSIGDHVWMGTNAVIVGNIKIGSNVLIAPGAFVNFDVPDHSLVLGNPGKVIHRKNPVENYIVNVLP